MREPLSAAGDVVLGRSLSRNHHLPTPFPQSARRALRWMHIVDVSLVLRPPTVSRVVF